jgi:transketolase N-terminal domain/subunit
MSCVEIVQAIYDVIKPDEKFILSKSHARRVVDALGIIPEFVNEVCPYGGSLGNGLGIAIGLSMVYKKVYVVCGDGEIDEGSFWEAYRYIRNKGIMNIKLIIDFNEYTSMRKVGISDIKDIDVICGHTVDEIKKSLMNNSVTVCKTIKGKGSPYKGLESHYKRLCAEHL